MDNIFGERFLGFRQPAWHEKGTVFTERISAVEAIQKANCDYDVVKYPMGAMINSTYAHASLFGAADVVAVPDMFVLTREPTDDDYQFRFFGYVSSEYEVLDNLEIGRALDVLTEKWPVETVGALDDGRVLFVVLDAGEFDVVPGKEAVKQYFIFTDQKDGRRRANFMLAPVRVVCQNTLVMAKHQSHVSASIKHSTGAASQLQLRVDIIDRLLNTQQLTIETLRAMAKTQITNEDAMRIISSAYPMPKKHPDMKFLTDIPVDVSKDDSLASGLFTLASQAQNRFDYMTERSEAFRESAFVLYDKINDEHPEIARTSYAAYNAVVELADWREGRGDIGNSSLWGIRAKEKERAYDAAQKISK